MSTLECLSCGSFESCPFAPENSGNCHDYKRKKEEEMKHALYLSENIESIEGAALLGYFNTIEEMWALSYKNDIGRRSRYCRYLMGKEFTSIDFGSWNRFLLVEPPLTTEELNHR